MSDDVEEEYVNDDVFFIRNIDETLLIIKFLTKKELIEGFLLTCWDVRYGYKRIVFGRKFERQDYRDVCSGIGIKLLEKFIEEPRFSLCRKKLEENVCKYIIMRGDVCPMVIENRRKNFNWNRKNYDLLKYSIEVKSIEFINFLLQKIRQPKKLDLDTKKMFVDIAISTKDGTILSEICKFFDFKTPTEYMTFKALIEKEFYLQFINRIKTYVRNEQRIPFKKEDVEEMIDILVERNQPKMITIILTYYDGSSVQETPLLRALALKHKECTMTIIDSGKFDVKVQKNQPIVLACKNGWINVVKKMVRMGANSSARDNTPIVLASRGGFHKLVEYLMKLEEVDPSYDENYALDEALRNGHYKVGWLLCSDKRVKTKILRTIKKEGRQQFLIRAKREGTFEFYTKVLYE